MLKFKITDMCTSILSHFFGGQQSGLTANVLLINNIKSVVFSLNNRFCYWFKQNFF